jgi:integrase
LRLTDAGGLYLEVAPNGGKRWFWKYYPDGKESRLALGRYPETTLRAARLARDAQRLKYKAGADPLQARRLEKIALRSAATGTFEAVAREYHALKSPGWSATYSERWLRQLDKDTFPWIGNLELRDITAPILLDALRRVERRGVNELAHSIRQACGQIMRYGVQTGRCDRNPATDLSGALKPVRTRHMGALLDPSSVGELLRDIDGFTGQPTTRAALKLSALLFQRPGNIRAMEWAHLDFAGAMWTIPSASMKRQQHEKENGRPHFVPLARQALEILREVQTLTGAGRYVFPALHTRNRCMSENTVRAALRRMGYGNEDMTAHGFRATARTLIAEHLNGVSPDVVEAQLAHVKSGPLGSAYDRADFMIQRRDLMQRWADYLDGLRAGA